VLQSVVATQVGKCRWDDFEVVVLAYTINSGNLAIEPSGFEFPQITPLG
jgi:hypothetical protein